MKHETFETFANPFGYASMEMKKKEPSAINFLSYKKYRITLEEIEEPIPVLIERLEKLLEQETGNHHRRTMIKNEIDRLNKGGKP